jgi:hypothetical protein
MEIVKWPTSDGVHQLGLNHEKQTYRYSSRDFRLTRVRGAVLQSVLS